MNGIAITTTEAGLTLNIPWRVWLSKLGLLRRKELTEEEALRIFEEGRREHREGKTVVFNSIKELLDKS